MRGKRFAYAAHTNDKRITPADAGKTPPVYSFTTYIKDHPRGCGENELGFTVI